jgi:hypothetical protein
MRDDTNAQKVLARVHRITGQLERVMRTIQQGRSAGDILLQLPDDRRQRLHELTEVFARHAGLERRAL